MKLAGPEGLLTFEREFLICLGAECHALIGEMSLLSQRERSVNKTTTILSVFGISFLLAGCSEEGKFEKAAIKYLKSELKDPDSAKITDTSVFRCSSSTPRGQAAKDKNYTLLFRAKVNAKNSYGGYTGEKNWFCKLWKAPDDFQCLDVAESSDVFCNETNNIDGIYK